MRSSPALYPAVEILHILGFVVLVGSILALDLRLLGLGRAIPLQPMAQLLLPLSRFVFLCGLSRALDLRLPGVGRAIPIQPMAQLLLPMSRFGFLLAISMGFLLFSADAAHVVRNPAFQTKLLLIAAALVNIVIAHVGPWRVALWRAEASGGAKVTALVSLLLWLSAVCAGRLISYF